MDRKKIILHLFPESYEQDAYAIKFFESIKGGKGEFYRSCFLAGLALAKIDNRLPAILSNILNENINANSLINTLKLLDITAGVEQTTEHKKEDPTENIAKKNAKSMFLNE